MAGGMQKVFCVVLQSGHDDVIGACPEEGQTKADIADLGKRPTMTIGKRCARSVESQELYATFSTYQILTAVPVRVSLGC